MDSRASTRTRLSVLPVFIALIFNLMAPLVPTAPSPTLALDGSAFDATDGNMDGADDWCGPLPVAGTPDPERHDNDDSFKSSAENDAVPELETGSISNSTDYKQIYVASETIGGELFAYVSFIRWDTNGTGTFSFELNQSGLLTSNGVTYQRTQDDVLLEFNFQKSADNWVVTLTYRLWNGDATSGTWSDAIPMGVFAEGSVNAGTIENCLDGDDSLVSGAFGEFAVNLTGLLGDDCSAFGSILAKSRASNTVTSNLDDLAGPIPVDFNTCGELIIKKFAADGQTLLPGATFSITPNPFTKVNETIVIADDGPHDADLTDGVIKLVGVEPGIQYTVCETDAPLGYIRDSTCRSVTVGANGSQTVQFINTLGSAAWSKFDEVTSTLLCGATFVITATGGEAQTMNFGPVTVVDNCGDPAYSGADADADGGEFKVNNLPLGDYSLEETVPPTGYGLPTPSTVTFSITEQSPNVIGLSFEDPRLLSSLKVEKRDTTDDGDLLDGAKFQLWLDDGDTAGELDANDTPVGSEVTASGGTYTWTDLGFGSYLVEETEAPTGYDLPDETVQGPFVINADNAGGLTFTVVFADPRLESELKVIKIDELTQEPLDGAKFELWLDANENGELDAEDTLVDPPGEVETSGGSYTWTGLDFGDYFVVETEAPAGYDLPDETVQGPFTIDPSNAGGLTHTVTFADPRIDTVIEVVKRDASDTEILLDGATFKLWEETNGTAGLQTDGLTPDTAVDSCTTVAGTCAFDAVTFGTYYVEETVAPNGYDLPDVTVQGPFIIGPGEEHEPGVTVTVTFDDPRQPGTIQAEKVDAADASIKLAGAEFQLYRDDGNEVFNADLDTPLGDVETSDASGLVMWTDLGFGTYFVVETKAPAGYDLPDGAVCGPLSISSTSLSASCTGEDAFADPRLPASLELDKQADADPINAGEEASFTITLWNTGPGDALEVTLHEDLPAGLSWDFEVVSGDATDKDCVPASSLTEGGVQQMSIDCDFGTLEPTSMADGIVIRVFADTERVNCGTLVNTASADGSNLDEPLTADDSIDVRCPTLVIDKVADAELITITGEAGDLEASPSIVTWTLTYTLTNGPVTDAVITDEIPLGFVFLDASGDGEPIDGSVIWTFDTLTESGSVTFRTTVDPETISRVAPTVNVAVIDSDETEPDEGEDSVTVEVEAPPLGGNPTPTPRPTPKPELPDTASGIGLNGEAVTVPLELLVALFIGSLGAMTLANVKARSRRR